MHSVSTNSVRALLPESQVAIDAKLGRFFTGYDRSNRGKISPGRTKSYSPRRSRIPTDFDRTSHRRVDEVRPDARPSPRQTDDQVKHAGISGSTQVRPGRDGRRRRMGVVDRDQLLPARRDGRKRLRLAGRVHFKPLSGPVRNVGDGKMRRGERAFSAQKAAGFGGVGGLACRQHLVRHPGFKPKPSQHPAIPFPFSHRAFLVPSAAPAQNSPSPPTRTNGPGFRRATGCRMPAAEYLDRQPIEPGGALS